MQLATCATGNMCNLQHMQLATCVTDNTCNWQYVQLAILATGNMCSEYVQISKTVKQHIPIKLTWYISMKPLASKLFIPEVKYLQITCPPPTPSSKSFFNNSFVTKNGMVKTLSLFNVVTWSCYTENVFNITHIDYVSFPKLKLKKEKITSYTQICKYYCSYIK